MLNAVQAMADPAAPPSKELILRTARRLDKDRRPHIAVHVIDTGPGIPADVLDRIFEPYFTTSPAAAAWACRHRAASSRATRPPGDPHRARRGSDFTILLPAL
jgi:signal transduction histidine kinase